MANENLLRGIDVSGWQKNPDWKDVASAGVRFAYLKASEGDKHVDKTFARNRTEAKANGIRVGAYHFGDLSKSAESNAQHFADVVGKIESGELYPVFDLEKMGIPDGMSGMEINQWSLDFAAAWAKLSPVPLVLYASSSRAKTPDMLKAYPYLWVAHWHETEPKGPFGLWDTWTIWQHSDHGRVAGIDGDVDLDYIRPEDLDKITVGGAGGGGLGVLLAAGLGILALTR